MFFRTESNVSLLVKILMQYFRAYKSNWNLVRSIFVPSRSLWLESSSNCFINKNCLIIISWALEKDKPLYNVRCTWFTVLEMYCYKRMRFLPIDIKYSHLYHVFFVFTKMCSKLFTYCFINNSLISLTLTSFWKAKNQKWWAKNLPSDLP